MVVITRAALIGKQNPQECTLLSKLIGIIRAKHEPKRFIIEYMQNLFLQRLQRTVVRGQYRFYNMNIQVNDSKY